MITRLYGDDTGETHFATYDLPVQQRSSDGTSVMRGLLDIPALNLSIVDLSDKAPPNDFHSTSPRDVVIVLRGAFDIIASDGDRRTFGPGDILLTDDVNTKGHAFEDTGDEPLVSIVINIGDDWKYPET
jgi:hypothetical protein